MSCDPVGQAEAQDMNLQAHLEAKPSSDRRSHPRKTLRLLTEARSGTNGTVDVLILDLSSSGMLVQADAPLEQGEVIEVELPETGVCEARVVWSSSKFFGCSFITPLPPGAVSAALLKGLPSDAAAAPGEGEPATTRGGLGRRLAVLRGEGGWSIEEIAARIGVSRQAVWYWETGQRLPRSAQLQRIAAALEVPEFVLRAEAGDRAPVATAAMVEEFRDRLAARLGCDKAGIAISISL